MIGAVWFIGWNNPYTNPPEGMPKILAEFYFDADDPQVRLLPNEVKEFFNKHKLLGSGYGIHWKPLDEITLPDSEKLAKIRRRRLEQRMKSKYPLVANQFIAEELEKRPNYYSGVVDQERINVLEKEKEYINRLRKERVIIYWNGCL